MDYRVIKEDDLFLMTAPDGDIPDGDTYGLGLYSQDTRFLSVLELKINGEQPIVISSQADQNYLASILLTNPHMEENGKLILWRESVELERKRFISQGGFYEVLKMTNYYPKSIQFRVSYRFDNDFHDMFIVRGFQNGQTGMKTETSWQEQGMTLGYDGGDGIRRETRVSWSEPSKRIDNERQEIEFEVSLKPGKSDQIAFFVAPYINGAGPEKLELEEAITSLEQSYKEWNQETTKVTSDYDLFNQLYYRGVQDLRVLLTDLGYGRFPVAGLPWYAVPFGRDSLITALQMLSLNRDVARGTLLTMAQYQGQSVDPWRDEQPGKIMHEIRYGELAQTKQIPFTPYYGTVDATPLFLMLYAEYFHWTGDIALAQALLPHVEKALHWIDEYGDRDGDLFVEYYQESSKGIANQGWKDSGDSVVHRNGEYAKAPIALAEVQGYVYQAKRKVAEIYSLLGKHAEAEQLNHSAAQLKQKFNRDFWMENEQFYAIALDADKKQVESITSNPGHLLMTGILNEERASIVAKRLVSPDMFSGYGIRTMGNMEIAYNPMSYHDGSIWPHDNSLAILGMSSVGETKAMNTAIEGLFHAAAHFEYYRLPELFCGYSMEKGHPVRYPVACSPQAWAAGTPVLFVQAMLGLSPNAITKKVKINPSLPQGMSMLHISELQLGVGSLDLCVKQVNGHAYIEVLKNTTGYEIVNDEVTV